MLSLLSGRRGQIESVHTRKTTMTKDKETQYERTGQIQQREISGHDLLSRFEEYRKKRKKGTEIPHEGKLDLPQGRRVFGQPRPLHRLRAGRHPPCGRPAKQHRQLLLPHADRRAHHVQGRQEAVPAHPLLRRAHPWAGASRHGAAGADQDHRQAACEEVPGQDDRQQMDEIGEAIEEALGLYVPEEMEAP